MTLRKNILWSLDAFNGSAIRKHFADIQAINSNYSSKENTEKRQHKLAALLTHAKTHTEFYKALAKSATLSDFPVVDKNSINANKTELLANNLTCASTSATSGSTGTPFEVEFDAIKKKRNTADSFYYAHKTGYDLGTCIYLIRIWKESLANKNPLTAWFQNIKKIEVALLNNDIEKFVDLLKKDKQPKTIIGHASSLDNFAQYLQEHSITNDALNILSIIPNAEYCKKNTKAILKERLGVPVVSRYSNSENGIIAQECLNKDGYYDVNWASYHVEILNIDNDEPAVYGETGRIVVTDLYNYRMPFIRYDTGDLGAMELHDGAPKICRIEGRKVDVVYDVEGKIVPAFTIDIMARRFSNIDQIQFIQHDKSCYEVIINSAKGFSEEEGLITEVKRLFGSSSTVKVSYVNQIPLLKSGKRRTTVNLYQPV